MKLNIERFNNILNIELDEEMIRNHPANEDNAVIDRISDSMIELWEDDEILSEMKDFCNLLKKIYEERI